jgi:hypothetical protein
VLPREYNATFQQAQYLAHAPGLAELLKPEGSGTVPRLAAMKEPTARVQEAFRRTYGRQADTDELAAALALADGADTSAGASSRDLLWALMTSAEFLTMP